MARNDDEYARVQKGMDQALDGVLQVLELSDDMGANRKRTVTNIIKALERTVMPYALSNMPIGVIRDELHRIWEAR